MLDAGVGLALLIPLPYSASVSARVEGWIASGTEIMAPSLWEYEVVSSLRKIVASGRLVDRDVARALAALDDLSVTRVGPTWELHAAALVWSDRIGDTVAYDGAYLAVAEQRGAQLWTTDQRLSRALKRLGADWVHLADSG